MCIVIDAVEGKNKESFRFFLADSDFLAESFRFSFPGEWQVWIKKPFSQINLF